MFSVERTVPKKNLGKNKSTFNYFDIIRRIKIDNKPFISSKPSISFNRNECVKNKSTNQNDVVYYFGQTDEFKKT